MADLSDDEAFVHIYPSDLERCKTSETTATVFSVAVGCPDEQSVPMFTREQVDEAIAADRALNAPQAAAEQAVPQKCEGCNGNGEVGGLRPDGYHTELCPFCHGTGTDAAPQSAPVAQAERAGWREVMQRLITGIDHLSEIARQWEPDYSSGQDRRGWVLATDARDEAARLLAAHTPDQTKG